MPCYHSKLSRKSFFISHEYHSYTIPQTQTFSRIEYRLMELQRLCASPLYSLRLDNIECLWTDPHNPMLVRSSERCQPFFTGLKYVVIKIHGESLYFGIFTIPKGLFVKPELSLDEIDHSLIAVFQVSLLANEAALCSLSHQTGVVRVLQIVH
ncbi:hypothetical protein WG66_014103 [Moniliophthora roreri]|nr:hypothetical protein WG66_014103 [Moniliophthora roreri]